MIIYNNNRVGNYTVNITIKPAISTDRIYYGCNWQRRHCAVLLYASLSESICIHINIKI